jgi:hypothetical protein
MMMKKMVFYFVLNLFFITTNAQTKWINLDALYQPLPASFHVYKSVDSLDGKPNIMYYAIAGLKDKNLQFTTDTTYKRRLTPDQFYQKNNAPLLVVNCAFFSFATDHNLNIVMKDGKLLGYNEQTIPANSRIDIDATFKNF